MNARILKDDVSDTPLKTQVTLDVVLTGATTREQLETLLRSLYNEVSNREGFKYSKRLTHVGIYVYATEAHALSGMGQWIGMISRTGTGAPPDMRIEDELLKHQSDSPTEKFGLTEQKRQEIWQEIVRAEDSASGENDKLQRKQALAHRYGLTLEQLSEIGTEGSIKNWPFPELEE
jgi:hypothetical protein